MNVTTSSGPDQSVTYVAGQFCYLCSRLLKERYYGPLAGLDWPEGFAALEGELTSLASSVSAMAFESYGQPIDEQLPKPPEPYYAGREATR
jgi:hypothetical protein